MGKKKKTRHDCSKSDKELFLKYLGMEKKDDDPTEVSECEVEEVLDQTFDGKSDEELFLEALDKGLNPDWVLKKRGLEPGASLKKKSKKKKKSGPDAVLDLHANTLEIALNRTERFLEQCRAVGKKQVLIIHGKGSGILKEGVRNYLSHHPLVSAFDDAQRRFGGSGAVLVFIK